MVLGRGPMHLTPIGVEIGDRALRAVQMRKGSGGWRMMASARVPRMDRGALLSSRDAQRLVGVLRRQGFLREEVALATPRSVVMTADLSFPDARGAEEIEESVRQEFQRRLTRSNDDVELAWWEIPPRARGGSAVRIAATGCAHREAEPLLDVLESCGLSILVMDTPAFALSRWIAATGQQAEVRLVIDVDWTMTHLVFVEENLVVYERLLPELGLRNVLQPLARQWEVEVEEAEQVLRELESNAGHERDSCSLSTMAETVLARAVMPIAEEVKKSIGYIRHQYPEAPPPCIVPAGEGARCGSLLRHLPTHVSAPMRCFDQPPESAGEHEVTSTSAERAVAMGMAWYEG